MREETKDEILRVLKRVESTFPAPDLRQAAQEIESLLDAEMDHAMKNVAIAKPLTMPVVPGYDSLHDL